MHQLPWLAVVTCDWLDYMLLPCNQSTITTLQWLREIISWVWQISLYYYWRRESYLFQTTYSAKPQTLLQLKSPKTLATSPTKGPEDSKGCWHTILTLQALSSVKEICIVLVMESNTKPRKTSRSVGYRTNLSGCRTRPTLLNNAIMPNVLCTQRSHLAAWN